MTKLEKLKAARVSADTNLDAAMDIADADYKAAADLAVANYVAACAAHRRELKKLRENDND